MMSPKLSILELTHPQLEAWLRDRNIAAFRTDQIFNWIYVHRVKSIEEMTNISKELRSQLEDHFVIGNLESEHEAVSPDGTRKFLFRLADGNHIETVLIPEKSHYTLCISSQVGCAQNCRFCMTARGGFIRNLTRGEIVSQVLEVERTVPENDGRRLSNIVIMGMGEPLANYHHLVSALDTLTDDKLGLNFSKRKITVSTAGLVPRMADLGRDTDVNLAVSLNATTNRMRDTLMPINRKFPIETLINACRNFDLAPRKRITFEYILMEGVNDSIGDAEQLAKLLKPVRSKINLIPFNEHEGSEYRRPDQNTIDQFLTVLHDRGCTAIIRNSKGADINAACGQLRANQKSGS